MQHHMEFLMPLNTEEREVYESTLDLFQVALEMILKTDDIVVACEIAKMTLEAVGRKNRIEPMLMH